MDLQTFYDMTDVTVIGYGVKDLPSMLRHPHIKRVCVERGLDILLSLKRGFRVSAVLNFPFGLTCGSVKEFVLQGVQELDIPIPIHHIQKSYRRSGGSWNFWVNALDLPERADLVYKIILHTDFIESFCESPSHAIKTLSFDINQAFRSRYPESNLVFKTSTGYGPGGATPEAVKALAEEGYRVKASGGIRSRARAEELKEAGASLFGIGFSSFNNIVKEFGEENGNNEQTTDERSNY